jgi:hypothetical protein
MKPVMFPGGVMSVNAIVAVFVIVTPNEVSVAVITATPEDDDLTAKITCPDEFVVPEVGKMVVG